MKNKAISGSDRLMYLPVNEIIQQLDSNGVVVETNVQIEEKKTFFNWFMAIFKL